MENEEAQEWQEAGWCDENLSMKKDEHVLFSMFFLILQNAYKFLQNAWDWENHATL